MHFYKRDLIDDLSNNPEQTVLIDTSRFQDIWISYYTAEDKVLYWKSGIDSQLTIYNICPRIWQKIKSTIEIKFHKK